MTDAGENQDFTERRGYGDGASYDVIVDRAARALFEDEIGPYMQAIGESWETQKPAPWRAHADAVLRAVGVTCLFCPAWDGSLHEGLPECAGCWPQEDTDGR